MVFIPLLRIVALWFPPLRIPMVSQLTGLLGQLGRPRRGDPARLRAAHVGLDAVLRRRPRCSACVLGVHRPASSCATPRTPTTSSTRSRSGPSPASVRAAWRTPGTRLGLWSHFSAQFGATVFALLWGYPFLVAGQGLSPSTAGTLLMLMTVTTVVSSPLIGGFVTKYPFSRSTLILGIVFAIMTVWAVVLLWPGRAPLPLLVVLVVVTAVGGPGLAGGLRPGPDLQPADPAGQRHRDRQRRRLPRLAVHRDADRDHPRPGRAGWSEHLRRRHLPGRDVGAVPRVGRRASSRSCATAARPGGPCGRATPRPMRRCGPGESITP